MPVLQYRFGQTIIERVKDSDGRAQLRFNRAGGLHRLLDPEDAVRSARLPHRSHGIPMIPRSMNLIEDGMGFTVRGEEVGSYEREALKESKTKVGD